MKILMVNTYDIRGGAARSAYRVFRALKDKQLDVRLMVQNKQGDDPDVIGPMTSTGRIIAALRPYVDFALAFPWHRKRTPFFPAILPGNFIKNVKELKPDLVHLNWIAGGFIRVEDLARIGVPLVWTLHDMWAFTGGCHYAAECSRYLQKCGRCPVLRSTTEHDPSRWAFNRKLTTYRKINNLTIISPSRWLADCARQSMLLKDFQVEVIPNSLDTESFFPEDKLQARKYFSIDPGRKIILFGALDATRNKLKGFDKLSEALPMIGDKENTELAVFGAASNETGELYGFRVRYFSHIADDSVLRKLYSAADVMVVPSIQEVFGQTATEAMACGTPVVAFGATGLLDIVEHQKSGYLAEPFKPEDLAAGIVWCIYDQARNHQLSENALARVREKFEMQKNIHQFISLYKRILDHQ